MLYRPHWVLQKSENWQRCPWNKDLTVEFLNFYIFTVLTFFLTPYAKFRKSISFLNGIFQYLSKSGLIFTVAVIIKKMKFSTKLAHAVKTTLSDTVIWKLAQVYLKQKTRLLFYFLLYLFSFLIRKPLKSWKNVLTFFFVHIFAYPVQNFKKRIPLLNIIFQHLFKGVSYRYVTPLS